MRRQSITLLQEEQEKSQHQPNGSELIPWTTCRVQEFNYLEFGYEFYNKTLLGRLLNPFVEFWRNFERDFQRDILLQQGLVKKC